MSIDVTPGADAELNRWYDDQHIPYKLSLPGYVSARRFVSAEAPSRYLAAYRLSDVRAALDSGDQPNPGSPPAHIRASWRSVTRGVWADLG